MKTRNTRQSLLDAAGRIVRRDGVSKLTLDAVAHEAGVSKGCVLYTFQSKNALVEGMLDEFRLRYEAELERALLSESGETGSWVRAFVKTTVAILPDETALGRSGGALFAAIASDAELLSVLQERFKGWRHYADESGIDPVLAHIVCLAVQGLWFAGLFGLAPPDCDRREEIVSRLLDMATPSDT